MHEAQEGGDHTSEVRLGAKEDGRAGAGGALFIFRPALLGCGLRAAGGERAVWACGRRTALAAVLSVLWTGRVRTGVRGVLLSGAERVSCV